MTHVGDPRLQFPYRGRLREVTNQCGDNNRLGVPRNAGNMEMSKGVTGYFRPPSAPYPPMSSASPTPVGSTFTKQGLKFVYHSAIHAPLPGDNHFPPTIQAPQTWGKHVSNNTVAGVGRGPPSNAPCWPSQPRPNNHQGQQCQSLRTQPIVLHGCHIPDGPKPHSFSSKSNKHSTENDLRSGQPFQGVGQVAPATLPLYRPQQFVIGHNMSPVYAQPHQEQSHRVASLTRNNNDSRNASYTTFNTSSAPGRIWGGVTTPPPPAPYPPLPQSAPRSIGRQSLEKSTTNHHHWSAMCSPLPEDRPSPPQGPRLETPRDRDTGAEKQQTHSRFPQPPNCDSSSKSKEHVMFPGHCQALEKALRPSAEGQHHRQQSRYEFALKEKPKPASNLESDRKHAQQSSSAIQGTDGNRGNTSQNGRNNPSYSIEGKGTSYRPDREGKGEQPDSKPCRVEDPRLAHGHLKTIDGRVREDSNLSGQKHIVGKDHARGRADERVEREAHESQKGGRQGVVMSVPRRVEDPRLAHGHVKTLDGRVREDSNLSGQKHIVGKDHVRGRADGRIEREAREGHRGGSQGVIMSVPRRVEDPRLVHGHVKTLDGRVRDDSNLSGQKQVVGKDHVRGRADERVEREAREGHRGVRKSCPPRRGGKDSLIVSGSLQVQGEDKLVEISKQIDALDVHTTNKVDVVTRAYLSLREYKASEKAGYVVYKGKSTVEELYATGKAYNPTTRRWIKVDNEKRKAAIQAAPSLLANVEMLENTVKLLTQRSQLLETKAEILKEQSTRPTVTLTTSTAPKLIVFDTNCFMHHLRGVKCRVADIAARELDVSVLVPKAVLAELDGLKKSETKGFSAREASRYLKSLFQMDDKRKFSIARFQEDLELYRDEGHHSAPHCLRGDASILNCCMFFAQGVTTPREVTLVTGDNNFEMQARANRFRIEVLPRCLGERCPRASCPARSQQRF